MSNVTRRGFLKVCGAMFGSGIVAPLSTFAVPNEFVERVPKNQVFDAVKTLANGINEELRKTYADFVLELPTADAVYRKDILYRMCRVLERYRIERDICQFMVVCDDSNNPVSVVADKDIVVDVYYKAIHEVWSTTTLRFSIYPHNNLPGYEAIA